jgi:UDP-galactopyranose mutase
MCGKKKENSAFNLVVYLSADWNTFHRQGLLTALATGLKGKGHLLCVNRPICPLVGTLKHRRRLIRWIWQRHLESITQNLFVYTPVIPLHDHLAHPLSGLVRINRIALKRQLFSVMREVSFVSRKRIAWVYHPNQIDYLGLVDEDFTVYECYDEYCYTVKGKFKRSVKEQEKKLVESMELIFAPALSLFQSRRKYGCPTYYISNAADYQLFAQARQNNLQTAAEVEKIPAPRIGYSGSISDRLDFELLSEVARLRPDWSLVMIGPVDKSSDFKLLTGLGNVHFLRRVERADLPRYLKGLDVALIPFVINDFTRVLNPLKTYEYLSTGTPIVSARLSELRKYEGIIRMADSNARSFTSAIEEALTNDNTERIRRGIEVGKMNSWDRVADEMIRILDKHMMREHRR